MIDGPNFSSHVEGNRSTCSRARIAFIVFAICLAGVLLGGSTYLWVKDALSIHDVGLAWAAFASIIAIWLSFHLIYLHITCMPNNDPLPLQQKIIRIILMVPIYAFGSWISLVFVEYELFIGLVRDIYESYVIYTFFTYLIDLIGGEGACFAGLSSHDEGRGIGHMPHPFPLCHLPPIHLGPKFLKLCRRLIIQYILVKPICSMIAIYLASMQQYHTGFPTPTFTSWWAMCPLWERLPCARPARMRPPNGLNSSCEP